MLLLGVSEKWCGFSFLGEHFCVVARGRKLYGIVPLCVGSSYVVWCCLVLTCGRQSLLRYCIEFLFVSHEVTDSISGISELGANIPQEGVAGPSSHDNYCLYIYFG